jgi:hypothetical protein
MSDKCLALEPLYIQSHSFVSYTFTDICQRDAVCRLEPITIDLVHNKLRITADLVLTLVHLHYVFDVKLDSLLDFEYLLETLTDCDSVLNTADCDS